VRVRRQGPYGSTTSSDESIRYRRSGASRALWPHRSNSCTRPRTAHDVAMPGLDHLFQMRPVAMAQLLDRVHPDALGSSACLEPMPLSWARSFST